MYKHTNATIYSATYSYMMGHRQTEMIDHCHIIYMFLACKHFKIYLFNVSNFLLLEFLFGSVHVFANIVKRHSITLFIIFGRYACVDSFRALVLYPIWEKPYYRCAEAWHLLGDLSHAIEINLQGQVRCSSNTHLRSQLSVFIGGPESRYMVATN